MRENDDPKEDREDEPENSEENINWLNQLASGAGSIWDESESFGDSMEDDIDLKSTGDEIPDWLRADLEKNVPVDEDVPEWLISEIEADGTVNNGDEVSDPIVEPIDNKSEPLEPLDDGDKTVLYYSEEPSAEEPTGEIEDQSPDDKKYDWLEDIAAGEGASVEEPQTKKRDDVAPSSSGASDELKQENLTWIGDLETMPEIEMSGDKDQEDSPVPAETVIPNDHFDPIIEEEIVDGREALYDEVPDDPDEAMAWLEQLAAKQGAPLEELPSMNEELAMIEADQNPDVEMAFELEEASLLKGPDPEPSIDESEEEFSTEKGEETTPPDIEDTLIYGMAGFTAEDVISQAQGKARVEPASVEEDIPEDPDEAMIWIEELSARQSAPDDEIDLIDDQLISDADEEQLEGAHATLSEDFMGSLDTYGLSGELDEALSWLEEMVELEEGDPEIAVEIVAEESTPHLVHDIPMDFVEQAAVDHEKTDLAPEVAEETFASVEDIAATDETAEAFAWLDHLAETGSDLPEDLTGPEVGESVLPVSDSLISSDLADLDGPEIDNEGIEIPTLESSDPVFAALEDPIQSKPSVDEIDEELAWLDTLGTVRAEEWISAEEEISIQTPELNVEATGVAKEAATGLEESSLEVEVIEEEIRAEIAVDLSPEEILGDNEQARLEIARSTLDEGFVDNALEQYEALLQHDSSLPFVISDLEAFLDRDGDQLLAKRTLGDAYVRNGQLKKALEVYRQALDTL